MYPNPPGGQGSVPTSTDSSPHAGTLKKQSYSRRTQRSCVLHSLSLCGVLKHVHTSARLGVASSSVSEHYHTLKNGDIQASALAEHVFKTGHAVDLSRSEELDHHQHTTTRCMLESWYIQQN